jgi:TETRATRICOPEPTIDE REPEAT FAMILY PROTEIN
MDEKEKEELLKEIEEYTKKIKEDPNNASYWNNRGNAYYEFNEYKKAIDDYNKAIELDPKESLYFYNCGFSYFMLKKYEKAIVKYNKAIELDPDNAFYWNSRGVNHYFLNKYKKAIDDYTQAIELMPNNASYWNNRGDAYYKFNEYNKAIDDYSKAIKLKPNNDFYFYTRGLAYEKLKQYEKAIDDYNKAIKLKPNDASYWNNRGSAYAHQKNYKEAIINFDKAIDLNPNDEEYYYNRGLAYNDSNNYKMAIINFDKAIELNPHFSIAYNNRGIIYAYKKNYKEAIINFDKAIDLNPSDSLAFTLKDITIEILKKEKSNKIEEFKKLSSVGNFNKLKEFISKEQDLKDSNNDVIKEFDLIKNIIKDKPLKLKGYLIFADILGWKGIWKKQDKPDELVTILFVIKSILEKETKTVKDSHNINLISDTFIIYSKTFKMTNKLSKKLIELCLENNLVIRGAISYGECYNKDTVYVGPAVDEAASWHDEGEEIGIFYTPSGKQEIISNPKIKNSNLLEDVIKIKSGTIKTFLINWYNKKTKKNFYKLFEKIDKSSIKIYLKYLNTEKKFDDYVND